MLAGWTRSAFVRFVVGWSRDLKFNLGFLLTHAVSTCISCDLIITYSVYSFSFFPVIVVLKVYLMGRF